MIEAKSCKTSLIDGSVKLDIAREGQGGLPPMSLASFIQLTAEQYGKTPGFAVKKNGKWE